MPRRFLGRRNPELAAALKLFCKSGAALVELGKFADCAHAAGSICLRYAGATIGP